MSEHVKRNFKSTFSNIVARILVLVYDQSGKDPGREELVFQRNPITQLF